MLFDFSQQIGIDDSYR